MDRQLSEVNYCVYKDEQNTLYFSITRFMARSSEPDTPQVREAVMTEMRLVWPGVLLLEEQTWTYEIVESTSDGIDGKPLI
jgi:hypothetical protein